jgi:hypothetical protein
MFKGARLMSTWDDLRCELEHTQQDCVFLYEKNQALERQLAEARELLLQIQDHMSQLSTHTHDGWSGSCADTVYEMIEEQLKEQG